MKKVIYCENCHKTLGEFKKGHYCVKDGTYQVGQGMDKPLLSFCGKKCLEEYGG